VWRYAPTAVMPREGGASSIPETAEFDREATGILDRPISPAMTPCRASGSIPAARSARALPAVTLESRGRRECRAPDAPAALCAERVGGTQAVVTTGSPKSHGTPCAMALRLTPRSPWCTGLSSHHRLDDSSSTRLDPSVGGSGPHGLTVHDRAFRQTRRHVHRIPHHVS